MKSISKIYTILLVASLAPAVSSAATPELPANEIIAHQVEAAVEHAMLAADPSGKTALAQAAAIDALAAPLDEALAHAPSDPALLYTKAFSHFAAAVPLRWAKSKAGMSDRYQKAVALLEKVRGGSWEKEASAFEGYIITQLIGVEGSDSAMELWPKADRLLSRAGKELPQSPRVLFFRGHVLWSIPAEVGGDSDKGLALMKASAGAFEAKQTEESSGPHWGHAYVVGWVGSGLKRKGDLAGAAQAWHQALALEPKYAFVEQKLLPSLIKKEKKEKPTNKS